MFDFIPNPVLIQLGPLTIGWYGLGYAIGLAATYMVMVRLARRAGERAEILANGMIIVAVAALIGGRLYHVIDQWALYKDDLLKIITPPYSGLGVYGGIATGIVAAFLYARYKKVPFLRWTDIVAPGLFTMQAIARWGNFFNQELYGSPTTLPWGIPIECQYRVADLLCSSPPSASDLATRFHPLFLYESISGVLGALTLIWVGFHLRKRLRPGDLFLVFLIWYGVVRFALEPLRHANWTFDGLPVAQIVSLLFIVPSLLILAWRHRSNHLDDDPPTFPAVATWGAPGRAVDFEEVPGSDAVADPTEPEGEPEAEATDPDPEPGREATDPDPEPGREATDPDPDFRSDVVDTEPPDGLAPPDDAAPRA